MSACGSDTGHPPLRTPAFVQDDLVHARGWASARVLATDADTPAWLEYAPLECNKTPDVCPLLSSSSSCHCCSGSGKHMHTCKKGGCGTDDWLCGGVQSAPVCVVPVRASADVGPGDLAALLRFAGGRELFLAVLGTDGTVVYLRLRPGIDEQPLETVAAREVSAHKRRRKGVSQ